MSAVARIDLAAIAANVGRLVEIAAPSTVMLAVKADGYGHGAVAVARAGLDAGARELAALEVPAGLRLRAAGIEAPIFAWLHGPTTDFGAAADAGIELGVSARWQLDAIAAARSSRPAVVHLKIDTGLSRNGASEEDWPGLVDRALELERDGVLRVRALWSHLADASEEEDERALARLHAARRVASDRGLTGRQSHLAASSAGIRMPEARLDLVRFGIAAYGISPFDDRSGADLGLTPAMTLESTVTGVHAGVATIAAGFADGVHPTAAGAAEVTVGGVRYRVLAIGVDTLTIAADDRVHAGDTALIFGSGVAGEATAEQWADWAGTIGDEIVTRVADRVPRVYSR